MGADKDQKQKPRIVDISAGLTGRGAVEATISGRRPEQAPISAKRRESFRAANEMFNALLQHNAEYKQLQLPWNEIRRHVEIIPHDLVEIGIDASQSQAQLYHILADSWDKAGGEVTTGGQIRIGYSDLAREMYGDRHISGQEYKDLFTTIKQLQDRKFLYGFKNSSGGTTWVRSGIMHKVFWHNPEGKEGGSEQPLPTAEIVFVVSELWRIKENKFVLLPRGLIPQLRKALEKDKIAPPIINFCHYLLRELSHRRGTKDQPAKIGRGKLIGVVRLEKYNRAGRKGRIEQRLSEAFEAANKIGLLVKWKLEERSRKTDSVYSFEINQSYFKEPQSLEVFEGERGAALAEPLLPNIDP